MRAFFLVQGPGYGIHTSKNRRRFTLPNQAITNAEQLVPTLHSPNTGNIIHREAMARIVKCDTAASTIGNLPGIRDPKPNVLRRDINYLNKNFDALVLSFANIIKARDPSGQIDMEDAASMRFGNLSRLVQGFEGQTFSFGMGIQDQLPPKADAIHPSLLDLLKTLDSKADILGVRGPDTAAWLHAIGISSAVTLGCPSLFVNPTVTRRIAPAPVSDDTRLATAGRLTRLGMEHKRLQPLLHLGRASDLDYVYQNDILALKGFPNAEVGYNYLTGELDRAKFAEREKRITKQDPVFRRHYVFNNPDIWRGYAAGRDAYIGDRFHGGVAFLQAGRPAGFVYRDARVRELTGYLGLPALSTEDVMSSTPKTLLYRINDGLPEFSRKYQAALETFVTTCDTAGLPLVYGAKELGL
ncbi:MAG: polysaccharide pyruvyl transferase family protein [Pseudomonadota bacterium]